MARYRNKDPERKNTLNRQSRVRLRKAREEIAKEAFERFEAGLTPRQRDMQLHLEYPPFIHMTTAECGAAIADLGKILAMPRPGNLADATWFAHDHKLRGVQKHAWQLGINHMMTKHPKALKKNGNKIWAFVITCKHPQYFERKFFEMFDMLFSYSTSTPTWR